MRCLIVDERSSDFYIGRDDFLSLKIGSGSNLRFRDLTFELFS